MKRPRPYPEDVSRADWRAQRRSGIVAIAVSGGIAAAVWLAIFFFAPPIKGMEAVPARMLFTLKCCCLAVLFTLVMGVEAVAHERLQSAAFDPLAGHQTRRLQVNLRYLQNTLEQIVVFAAGLFGLAAYSADGEAMRAVIATTVVWILSRFGFWVGYHRSAAMRGIGAPGVIVSLLMLLYVCARVGDEIAGITGALAVLACFFVLEAILFHNTRTRDL